MYLNSRVLPSLHSLEPVKLRYCWRGGVRVYQSISTSVSVYSKLLKTRYYSLCLKSITAFSFCPSRESVNLICWRGGLCGYKKFSVTALEDSEFLKTRYYALFLKRITVFSIPRAGKAVSLLKGRRAGVTELLRLSLRTKRSLSAVEVATTSTGEADWLGCVWWVSVLAAPSGVWCRFVWCCSCHYFSLPIFFLLVILMILFCLYCIFVSKIFWF